MIKLKELRMSREWSQSELARRCNVTTACIHSLEAKPDREPDLRVAINLSSAFKISLDELCGLTPSSQTEHLNFYCKFGILDKLNAKDQQLILEIANRLKN